eukprot:SAG31_NODE_3575_length_4110_cov_2.432560_7_plen_106_part_00
MHIYEVHQNSVKPKILGNVKGFVNSDAVVTSAAVQEGVQKSRRRPARRADDGDGDGVAWGEMDSWISSDEEAEGEQDVEDSKLSRMSLGVGRHALERACVEYSTK